MSAPIAASPVSPPLRHSYWVIPGLLLAGEHPDGQVRDETRERLQRLVSAGIQSFVDLTKPTELPRYDTHLPDHVKYSRRPIKDHGLPSSRAQMIEILEYVGDSMRAGRPVYVHCRAGIGRTGTVIGCVLVERGLTGDGALDELNRLWQQSRRSSTWAYIPETDAQSSYVRAWTPSTRPGTFELGEIGRVMEPVRPVPPAVTAAGVRTKANGKGSGLIARGGLSAAAAQARAAVERGEIKPSVRAQVSEAVKAMGRKSGVAKRAPVQPEASMQIAPPPGPAAPVERPPEATATADPLLDPDTLTVARGLRERYVGTLFGLAVGDAVAAATQFKRPGQFTPVGDMLGGGPFDLPRGAWTDDTAMALCLADSLLEKNGFDPRDQVQRYSRWQQEGYLSSTGQCVGITASTARALALAKWRRVVFPGSHDPDQQDPEPLSRIGAVALFYLASLDSTLHHAAESSRVTCQATFVLDACKRLARALNAALAGQPKGRILAEAGPISDSAAQSNHTAATALAAAFWAFATTDNFRDALLRAANVGGNSDVVASVCGQLAGAHYGASAIPVNWRNGLIQQDLLEGYADRLLTHGLVSLSAPA